MVVVLINSKHSVLRKATTMVSSVTTPAHKHGVASGTMYSTTTTTRLEGPQHSAVSVIDLYDMARIQSVSSGQGSDTKGEWNMRKAQQSDPETCDV